MNKGQIRFLKVGSQLAVRFDIAVMDDHGCPKLVRTADGKVTRLMETYWLPATVVAIEDGYPLIEGTTAQARGFRQELPQRRRGPVQRRRDRAAVSGRTDFWAAEGLTVQRR